MFIVAVLSVLACAFAADPDPSDKSTFHDTGSLLWKDCGGGLIEWLAIDCGVFDWLVDSMTNWLSDDVLHEGSIWGVLLAMSASLTDCMDDGWSVA